MKKVILVLLVFALAGGTAFSFDISSFPSPIKKGDIMVSPTFNYGSTWGLAAAIAITGSVDYALSAPIALTVGGEAGYAMVTGGGDFATIPIFGRIAWHPNFEAKNLDTYVTLKLGYNVPLTKNYSGGFSYGSDVGLRYFFSPTMAVFGEVGYDYYSFSFDEDLGWLSYSYSWWLYTWFHAGITFKL